MSQTADPNAETVLRWCGAADPEPWYPAEHARQAGIERPSLDHPAEQLRMAGYIELTEWVSGKGQGYALTPAGRDLLKRPGRLAKLASGMVTPVVESAPSEDRPRTTRRPVTAWERGEIVRHALVSRSRAHVTWVLLAINLLVFVIGIVIGLRMGLPLQQLVMGQARQVTHLMGALQGGDLANGQWWRLLTCCFVHHGMLHLGMNMLSLVIVGPLVERLWGHGRFLVLYLLSGVAGSVAGIYQDPQISLAGASGAIWGMLVSFLAWLILNRAHLPLDALLRWGGSLVFVLVLNVYQSMQPHISWQGHAGGGAAGALAAVLLNLERFGSHTARGIAILLLAIMPVGCVVALARQMHQSLDWRQTVEVPQFNDIIPAVRAATEGGPRLNTPEFRRLFALEPADRPGNEVAAMTEDLETSQFAIRVVLDRLQAAQFRVPGVVEASEAAEKLLTVREELLGALIEKLRSGDNWTDEREQRLESLWRSDRQARQEYQRWLRPG